MIALSLCLSFWPCLVTEYVHVATKLNIALNWSEFQIIMASLYLLGHIPVVAETHGLWTNQFTIHTICCCPTNKKPVFHSQWQDIFPVLFIFIRSKQLSTIIISNNPYKENCRTIHCYSLNNWRQLKKKYFAILPIHFYYYDSHFEHKLIKLKLQLAKSFNKIGRILTHKQLVCWQVCARKKRFKTPTFGILNIVQQKLSRLDPISNALDFQPWSQKRN